MLLCLYLKETILMRKMYLLSCCLLFVLHSDAQQRKWQYRIGLDAFVADLVNIEEIAIDHYSTQRLWCFDTPYPCRSKVERTLDKVFDFF